MTGDLRPTTKFAGQLESGLSRTLEHVNAVTGPIIVGVSGGADSVALLSGLHAISRDNKFTCHVLHVNHLLRDVADADARFVAGLADELGVACDVVRIDVHSLATEQGVGTEEAARKARYHAFVDCAKRIGSRFVAVAHHQDDQVETVLHHIIRGTGLKGLEGIPRTRELCDEVTLVRPMLDISRSTIMEFIQEQQLNYCEDETNRDNAFTRNRIRNELLPLIERDFNPRVRESLLRLAQQAGEAQTLIDDQVIGLLERSCEFSDVAVRIRCDLLRDVRRGVLRSLMREVWVRQNWPRKKMGFSEWDSLVDVIHGSLSGRDLPGSINVSRRRAIMTLRQF